MSGKCRGAQSGKEAILGRLHKALASEDTSRSKPSSVSDAPSVVTDRLSNKPRSTMPAFREDATERLIRLMESVEMTVARVQTPKDVVNAVDDYIASEGLDGDVTVAPALSSMPWPESFRSGSASGTEATSVTPCLAAVAETGSVVFSSSGDTPAALNFLPDNHIVVVNESQIVNHVDDVWAMLRKFGSFGTCDGDTPRAVNFVTGPSRTGDIEQTIEIGAHGPRRMHVVLVSGA